MTTNIYDWLGWTLCVVIGWVSGYLMVHGEVLSGVIAVVSFHAYAWLRYLSWLHSAGEMQ